MNDRPNIIFINTDQHTWDAVSALGNQYVKTPNIDWLHREGIAFRKSYSADPVCAPARASWMTGVYGSENGVPFNGGHMHADIPDLGQLLNQGGYHAVHSGKWHIEGRDVRDSFNNLYVGKAHIGASGGEFYDKVSTHAVIDFFDNYDDVKPFFLHMGIIDPHDICQYQHNHEDKVMPGPFEQFLSVYDELPPLPENFSYDGDETVLQQVFRRGDDPLIHPAIHKRVKDWTELQWRFMAWNHNRFVEAADDHIGMVLNALFNSRFSDNTIIIFSVDHGEANGRHESFQKFSLYEESIRVPFVIASLGNKFVIPKNVIDDRHFISGVDLMPTVLDYAGIDVPQHVQGRSLRPLVEQSDVQWRTFAYVESNYWARAVITERYKYVMEYRPRIEEDFIPIGPDQESVGKEQLFDLANDPMETENLSGDSVYSDILNDCRKRLFLMESDLKRRQLDGGRSKETVLDWSGPLNARWQNKVN